MNPEPQSGADEVRASAMILRFAATKFLEAGEAAGDRMSVAVAQGILELLKPLTSGGDRSCP